MPASDMAKKLKSKKGKEKREESPDMPQEMTLTNIEKHQDSIDQMTSAERKTKWQKFKKAVSRKMSVKKKKKATEVMEVNIVQEDETDYEKQWSRKMNRPGSRWNDTCSADSSRGSSPGKEEEAELPEDGIKVIHDADDDDNL